MNPNQKNQSQPQKKSLPLTPFSQMSLKQRFEPVVINNIYYAAHSWGCPAITMTVDQSVFRKTDEERGELATLKKQHNEKVRKIFGTKRPSAGIVRRYYLNLHNTLN